MRNVDEGYTHFRRQFHLRHTRHRFHEPCKMFTEYGASDGRHVTDTQNVDDVSRKFHCDRQSISVNTERRRRKQGQYNAKFLVS